MAYYVFCNCVAVKSESVRPPVLILSRTQGLGLLHLVTHSLLDIILVLTGSRFYSTSGHKTWLWRVGVFGRMLLLKARCSWVTEIWVTAPVLAYQPVPKAMAPGNMASP